jgi:hypothetical protein
MRYLCLLIALMFSSQTMASSCPSNLNKKASIDEYVSRSVDVDADDMPDKIELHLKANNFYSPFEWELKIYSKNIVIYRRNGSNDRIDKFFSDPNFIGGCKDYDDCKCQWYFQGFLDRMTETIGLDNAGIFDKAAPNSIYVVAKKALKIENKNNANLVKKAINNAANRLSSGKAVVISVFDEPEVHTPLMIWMPEFKRFVPIYEQ